MNPAEQTMMYDANKRSVGVAYLLWFFLGWLGGHRFYAGKKLSGFMQLALNVIAWCTLFIYIGTFFFAVLGIWVLIDAFLIPGWIRDTNTKLATSLSTSAVVTNS
jgi:TM2 domain-containing membrane protein YozV